MIKKKILFKFYFKISKADTEKDIERKECKKCRKQCKIAAKFCPECGTQFDAQNDYKINTPMQANINGFYYFNFRLVCFFS